jgi:hypothetical protein
VFLVMDGGWMSENSQAESLRALSQKTSMSRSAERHSGIHVDTPAFRFAEYSPELLSDQSFLCKTGWRKRATHDGIIHDATASTATAEDAAFAILRADDSVVEDERSRQGAANVHEFSEVENQ